LKGKFQLSRKRGEGNLLFRSLKGACVSMRLGGGKKGRSSRCLYWRGERGGAIILPLHKGKKKGGKGHEKEGGGTGRFLSL